MTTKKALVSKDKNIPSWSDVKAKLADFDRAGILGLVQDLNSVSRDYQTFLHTRFGRGGDALKPSKTSISRWLWPETFKNQDTSVAKAKKAISDYKRAIGRPEELAELMTFYCEQAAGFSREVSLDDEGYFDALVRMFAQALKSIVGLPKTQRDGLLKRLDQARCICHQFGYGVGDAMDELLVDYGIDE